MRRSLAHTEASAAETTTDDTRKSPPAQPNVHIVDAARQGRLDLVQAAVESGAHADSPCPSNGSTALIAAAKRGHMDILKYLIEQKSSLNWVNSDEHTALDDAMDGAQPEAARLLRQHGGKRFQDLAATRIRVAACGICFVPMMLAYLVISALRVLVARRPAVHLPRFGHASMASLGCSCTIAENLRLAGLRGGAKPLDWLVTPMPALLAAIRLDFAKFCKGFEWKQGHVFSDELGCDYYHDFESSSKSDCEGAVMEKYGRRVARFRELYQTPEMVFFRKVKHNFPDLEHWAALEQALEGKMDCDDWALIFIEVRPPAQRLLEALRLVAALVTRPSFRMYFGARQLSARSFVVSMPGHLPRTPQSTFFDNPAAYQVLLHHLMPSVHRFWMAFAAILWYAALGEAFARRKLISAADIRGDAFH